ncbi:protein-glutamate O-methyltransferase CheR [Paracoccus suum]|uniref:Chemotaxis protein methyltransferase n=2 Tax=Paracoccus suum TaxID=2259340 RepID=A0A344PPK9_9RHOB|nr:protein-glutamate O-methyltransferase CheR [Paracoccus suum]
MPGHAADPTGEVKGSTLERVRALILDASGIVLGDNKASMVRARLSKRLAATGHGCIEAYLDFVERADDGTERNNLVSAMTTNVTHFFREAHHFDQLRRIGLDARATGQKLNIWSAGCSSGQEPFSIAMTLADAGFPPRDVRILATDIDSHILALASRAIYPRREIQAIPPGHRAKSVLVEGEDARIAPVLRSMVDFRLTNLVGDWSFSTPFDVIFCRNVAIYFDPPTQAQLWSRMVGALRPGGWLFVGHSERLPDRLLTQVRYAGQTTYKKIKAEGGTAR